MTSKMPIVPGKFSPAFWEVLKRPEAGSLIAIIYYKDYRAVIPISEMMINLIQDETHDYGDLSLRQNKVYHMLGCEIDFVVKKDWIPNPEASLPKPEDAMLKKTSDFLF